MYNISFDFDEQTKKVSNVKVEELKTKEALLEGAFVSVLDNKLQLTKDAIALLGVKPGEHIAINFYDVDNETKIPVIGRADAFSDDASNGNKLTKSGTVSFKGFQRKILLEYGSLFKVSAFKEKMFQLSPQAVEEQEEAETKAVEDAKSTLDNFVGTIKFNYGEDSSQTDDLPF